MVLFGRPATNPFNTCFSRAESIATRAFADSALSLVVVTGVRWGCARRMLSRIVSRVNGFSTKSMSIALQAIRDGAMQLASVCGIGGLGLGPLSPEYRLCDHAHEPAAPATSSTAGYRF